MNRDFEDLGGRDPYEILGVGAEATPEEINRTYRQRVRLTHPDTGGSHDEQATLNLAREILLDPVRRRAYEDRWFEPDAEEVPDEPYTDPYEWSAGAGPAAADPSAAYPPPVYDPPPPPRPTYHVPAEQVVYFPPPNYPPFRPPAYSQPYAPGRRGWNSVAVISLVLTICFPPVGLILSIIALSQIRRTRERGAVLAGLALAISGLTVLGCVGMGLVSVISTTYRAPFVTHSSTVSPSPSAR
jgi:hypothetical protein